MSHSTCILHPRVSTTYDNFASIVVRRSVHIQKFAVRIVAFNRVAMERVLELMRLLCFKDHTDAKLRFGGARVVPLVDFGA